MSSLMPAKAFTTTLRPLTAPSPSHASSAALFSPLAFPQQSNIASPLSATSAHPLHLTLFNGLLRPIPGVLEANFSPVPTSSSVQYFLPSHPILAIPRHSNIRRSTFSAGSFDRFKKLKSGPMVGPLGGTSGDSLKSRWRRLGNFVLSPSSPLAGSPKLYPTSSLSPTDAGRYDGACLLAVRSMWEKATGERWNGGSGMSRSELMEFKAFVFESLSTLSPLHAPPLTSPTHHSLHQPHDLIASPRTIYTLQLSVGSIRGLDPACLPGSPFFCTLKVHACGVEVWEWKARRLAGKDAVFERVGETELALSKEDIERGEIEVVLGK
ncbi:hypothetical protein TrRE_jg12857, partial [Triparma retinervis]